jgi:hypothetical protein
MMRNVLCAVVLLSMALTVGCAVGGNGIVNSPSVTVSITTPPNTNPLAIYPTQTVTLTADTTDPNYAPITWTLSGGGTILSTTPPTATTSATATYQAPAAAGTTPTITAAFTSTPSVNSAFSMNIVDITTQVAPATLNVGSGLIQQFTATAVPDAAPQTFQWTCTANNVQCPGSDFSQDPNISGLAYYTGQSSCIGCTVAISAVTPLDPTGCVANPKYCTAAKATVVASRVNGTYAFQFSGYDTDGNPVAVAGTFTTTNDAITTGVEDLLNSGGWAKKSITGGSYTPTSGDNGNNAGTLKLTLPSGVYPDQFQVVLDGNGDLEMIESDKQGTGSGIAQVSSGTGPFKGAQVYAFGFTGTDSGGKRIGYAGVLPMDGSGNIVSGQIDVNDNGSSSNSICGSTPPCSVAGTYSSNGDGSWNVALTSPVVMNFDFYIAGGANGKSNPLILYAISTDPATNPAVSGTMALQDNTQTYNNSAFNGVSVSTLTGVDGANANVSLTLGDTDGDGDFSGQYDQNDAGTINAAIAFPGSSTAYTYAASSTTSGRYIFQMLGNPGAKTAVPPIPVVLYASGANRGFLLDQSSAAVMTGAMIPQGKVQVGGLSGSELPGTFAAATTSSANSAVVPLAANLLFTSVGNAVYNVTGTEYPGGTAIAENYTLGPEGTGTIVPISPATTPNYAIYAIGTLGCTGTPKNPNPACAVTSFMMIDEDTTNTTPSVIFAQE